VTSTRHRCDLSGRIHGHAVHTPNGTYPWEIRIYGPEGKLLTTGYHRSAAGAETALPEIVEAIQRIIRDASLPETDEQRAQREERARRLHQAQEAHLAKVRADEAAWAEHLRQLAEAEGRSG
jgi:hypothetical protein